MRLNIKGNVSVEVVCITLQPEISRVVLVYLLHHSTNVKHNNRLCVQWVNIV